MNVDFVSESMKGKAREVYDPMCDISYWSLSMEPHKGGSGMTRMRRSEIIPWIVGKNEQGVIVAIKEIKFL